MTTTSLLAGGMDMDEFAAYLQSQDAQILPPKSYEVLRYHHQEYGTAIVHHNKDGRIRFSDVAWEHYKRFRSNVPLANPIRTPRSTTGRVIALAQLGRPRVAGTVTFMLIGRSPCRPPRASACVAGCEERRRSGSQRRRSER